MVGKSQRCSPALALGCSRCASPGSMPRGGTTKEDQHETEQRMKSVLSVLVALSLGLLLCGGQETYLLDPATSVIQIHLDTAGALGFVGHPHLIQTRIAAGSFVYYPSDLGKSSVELVVDASALQVLDPKRPAKERKEIQATMQSDRVLDIKQYPKLVFRSVKIEPMDRNRLRIAGNLTIRNQTHPVTVDATLEQGGVQLKAVGKSQFKQTTFGMHPVTAGLGTVRVRDQITISFVVFGQPKVGGI
jgi:polyisoprenoid-binding protein YceI